MNPKETVKTILEEYFGEDRVDVQDNIIYILFPVVKVANEYNEFTIIKKLFVELKVTTKGMLIGTFNLARSEYTYNQFSSGYCHSHVPSIDPSTVTKFQQPCLGSGPIKRTCASLNAQFDEDIWKLFCIELDKYVKTESISGGPYMRLSQIGNRPGATPYPEVLNHYNNCVPTLDPFVEFVIKSQPFQFNYNGVYFIALSQKNIILTLSSLFIKWYNALPEPSNLRSTCASYMTKGFLYNNKLYLRGSRNSTNYTLSRIKEAETKVLCKFKGVDQKITITDIENPEKNKAELILLDNYAMGYVVHKIIKLANIYYGKSEGYQNRNSRGKTITIGSEIRVI